MPNRLKIKMNKPNTIRYPANTVIGFFCKNAINFLTTTRATRKLTTKPIARLTSSMEVMEPKPPNWINFNALIHNMTGIARKNENSALAVVERPATHPPIIVEALLLIPGIIDRHWKQPIIKDCLVVT